ncbi:hypothetical protein PoB_005082000 [Plakobranchus ocellatus]|uniref:Uncharacterized protein n=1 Tax=Plakobranchus ocellatus TaxID=259542 RepID=A0AAV4BYT6_9GAST|nr:hypothetical protein PoB_005082000 [Plakobranchus ocellatus]
MSDINTLIQNDCTLSISAVWGVGGPEDSKPAVRSAGLTWIRSPTPTPWRDGGPESLRSPCCGLIIYKSQTKPICSLELEIRVAVLLSSQLRKDGASHL